MKLEDLQTFCAEETDPRFYLQTPFSIGDGNTYATNGHICVCLNSKLDGVTELHGDSLEKMKSGIPRVLKTLPVEEVILDFNSLPDLQYQNCYLCKGDGEIYTCPECDGEGTLTFESTHNEYEVDCNTCWGNGQISKTVDDSHAQTCKECDGSGKELIKNQIVQLMDGDIKLELIKKLTPLPGIKLYRPTEYIWPFTFDGGKGVVAGLLK